MVVCMCSQHIAPTLMLQLSLLIASCFVYIDLVLIGEIDACVCMQCAGSTTLGTAPSSRSAHLAPQTCFKELLSMGLIVLWCLEGAELRVSTASSEMVCEWMQHDKAVSDSSLLGLNYFLIDDYYRVTCYALSKRTR